MKSKKLISLGIMAAMLTGMVLTGCGQSQQAGETDKVHRAAETTESTSAEVQQHPVNGRIGIPVWRRTERRFSAELWMILIIVKALFM